MARDFLSEFMLEPKTDDPRSEARDLTNAFKDRVQQIADPECIHAKSFDDYLDDVLDAPKKPTQRSARWQAKSNHKLHFWSGWIPWIKSTLNKQDTSYKEYLVRKGKMEAEANDIYRSEVRRYNHDLDIYTEERSQMAAAFEHYDIDLINKYFRFVLLQDTFSIDNFDDYDIEVRHLQYDMAERALLVSYRIPAKEEIIPLDYFFYDDDAQAIRDRQLSSGIAADYRNDVARRVLLRAAATIFMSDEYKMIDSIELHGFLNDESTDGRAITVIRLVIPRKEIMGRNPDFIDTKADFITVFQEERSPDLYKVDSYQLRELLSKPRTPKTTSASDDKQIQRKQKK